MSSEEESVLLENTAKIAITADDPFLSDVSMDKALSDQSDTISHEADSFDVALQEIVAADAFPNLLSGLEENW